VTWGEELNSLLKMRLFKRIGIIANDLIVTNSEKVGELGHYLSHTKN
jgi:hypothetical protein